MVEDGEAVRETNSCFLILAVVSLNGKLQVLELDLLVLAWALCFREGCILEQGGRQQQGHRLRRRSGIREGEPNETGRGVEKVGGGER